MIKNLLKKFNIILLLFLTSLIYRKFQKSHQKKFGKRMPVVLVGGNVGKSSQTLLLNQLYTDLGYKVWTGTSTNKNRNTLTGLVMVLGEFDHVLEQSGIFSKLSFLIKAKIIWLLKSWNFGNKPNILIFEVGVDHQNESHQFVKLFKLVDWVILSNFGPEHTAGFSKDFDEKSYSNITHKLNGLFSYSPFLDLLNTDFNNEEKNCYLEQLKLLSIAKCYALPSSYNISNKTEIIVFDKSFNKKIPSVKRLSDFTLEIEGYKTNPDYFLPFSFARQIIMAKLLFESNSFSTTNLDQVWTNLISNFELPNGRFGFFDGINNTKIIDGSYNSDPASLKTFFDQILEVGLLFKTYLIIGEMRELGISSVEIHNQMLDYLDELPFANKNNLEIILLGETWIKCRYDKNKIKHFDRVGQVINYFKKIQIPEKSWFWIKGSQNTIFLESLVDSLLLHQKDKSRLARIGGDWDEIRKPFLAN